jgi:hypothetical protein
VTGACSAPAIDGCKVVTLSFEGSVASVDPALAACFALGDPVVGSAEVDPEAPDLEPADIYHGIYPGLEAFALQIGAEPSGLSFVGETPSDVWIEMGFGVGGYRVSFDAGLNGPALACGTPTGISLGFGDGDAILASELQLSDVMPPIGSLTARAVIEFPGPDESHPQWWVAVSGVLTSPEPGDVGAALASGLALARVSRGRALAARRRSA